MTTPTAPTPHPTSVPVSAHDRIGVVLMAYGTPRTRDEILPYYTDIRRGRPPTDEQLADLVARYEAIAPPGSDIPSPLAARTEAQRDALQAALDAMVAPDGPLWDCGLLRGKGVFRTERAWYGWQWVDGRVDWQESAWRADSRVELLANGSIDPQAVDIALRAAVSKG